MNDQILQHMMDSIWMNIATIFMTAAMGKKNTAITERFFGIFYFISYCLV